MGESAIGLGQRVAGLDERSRVDPAVGQRADRTREVAAARADEAHLVDDEWREIERELRRHRGLQYDGAARRYEGQGAREAALGPGRLHHERGASARCVERVLQDRPHPKSGRQSELVRVVSDQGGRHAVTGEGGRAEDPELAVSEHDRPVDALRVDLVEHVERRGERLGEDRTLVADARGHFNEAPLGDDELFGERAAATDDAEHGARRAVVGVSGGAGRARAAAGVDVGDDALPKPGGVVGFRHLADELVARHAAEAHVAARELEVRVTDAGGMNANARLAGSASGSRMSRIDARGTIEEESEHAASVARSRYAWRMRIVAVADTHMYHDELVVPEGDVFVHAGDMCRRGSLDELASTLAFVRALPHRHKIVVAGNHDWAFVDAKERARALCHSAIHYLEDDGVSLDGVSFWGSPWQPTFHDWAFNLPRGAALAEKWELVPERTDVVVTHGPPAGIGDRSSTSGRTGCEDLRARMLTLRPRLHLFGHIHEDGGLFLEEGVAFVNVTTWECERAPTVIDLDPVTGIVTPVHVPPTRPTR